MEMADALGGCGPAQQSGPWVPAFTIGGARMTGAGDVDLLGRDLPKRSRPWVPAFTIGGARMTGAGDVDLLGCDLPNGPGRGSPLSR